MNKLTALIIIASLFASCEKDEIKLASLASLNITNAIVGGTTAKLGSNAAAINNNAFTQFALKAGDQMLYVYPSADSLHPYYSDPKFAARQGEVYSLFLAGTPTAIDPIFLKENIPFRTDSTAGIRFINLAPNKPNLNITLSTSTTVNEVSNLTYKNFTEFKSYPGLATSTYTFQVRDASNPGTVLASQSFTAAQVPRFANITLVIRQNGTGVAILRVNNDR